MMLRIQLERQKKINFPSMREYFDFFALTPERLLLAADHAVVMHPGPMNRGVEIDSSVADGEQSVILDQVTNGVAIRMAILYLLAGGRSETASDS
jgi:aspartate carbamoyltransferase catalytic subunit